MLKGSSGWFIEDDEDIVDGEVDGNTVTENAGSGGIYTRGDGSVGQFT